MLALRPCARVGLFGVKYPIASIYKSEMTIEADGVNKHQVPVVIHVWPEYLRD